MPFSCHGVEHIPTWDEDLLTVRTMSEFEQKMLKWQEVMVFNIEEEKKALKWKPMELTKRVKPEDQAKLTQLTRESINALAAQIPAIDAAAGVNNKRNQPRPEGMSDQAAVCIACRELHERDQSFVGNKKGRQKVTERNKTSDSNYSDCCRACWAQLSAP
ncbi:uncharacterized protein J3D65DRAFT_483345 [Phyllosticta citribraziliensis]|uniref:Uncharacterized protein n=1 Tax=Phyllosticta citribraziliensis TaxID=989973 RepID=A0ABR1LGL8_9PEZI